VLVFVRNIETAVQVAASYNPKGFEGRNKRLLADKFSSAFAAGSAFEDTKKIARRVAEFAENSLAGVLVPSRHIALRDGEARIELESETD
jgi:hypothetical protein